MKTVRFEINNVKFGLQDKQTLEWAEYGWWSDGPSSNHYKITREGDFVYFEETKNGFCCDTGTFSHYERNRIHVMDLHRLKMEFFACDLKFKTVGLTRYSQTDDLGWDEYKREMEAEEEAYEQTKYDRACGYFG